jgi:cytochrome b subunit of formate dehydrogenase
VKDLFGHLRWFLGLGPKPQFERYAYWEKFDYWAVFWGMIVIGFSGYAMWFAPFFAHFLPGWALNAVLVIHSEEGLLAILFIFSIHFVNTHLRPDSFPMDMVVFTGVESEEEFATSGRRSTSGWSRRQIGNTDWRCAAGVAGEFLESGRIHGDLYWADAAGAYA